MELIIGGAYQGKLDVALKRRGSNAPVYQGMETETEIDFSADIINSLHRTILAQQRIGMNSYDYMKDRLGRLEPKTVICDDISCGVVPMDVEMRLWRETTGRVLLLLSENADEVIRVFCGLETKLKAKEPGV